LSHFVTMCNQPLSIADEEGRGGVSSAESEEAAQATNDSFSYSIRGTVSSYRTRICYVDVNRRE
jgi:hypothetical protein